MLTTIQRQGRVVSEAFPVQEVRKLGNIATISATLNEDLYILQSLYRSEGNLEAKMMMDEVINLSDQLSKLQLPGGLFFERLLSSARNIGVVYKYSEAEMIPLNDVIDMIKEHQARYASKVAA